MIAQSSSLRIAFSQRVRDIRIRCLALPIFYKVLIANTLIVVLGAVAGSWVTLAVADNIGAAGRIELIVMFAAIGVLLSVAVNFAVLKAAFRPLVQLEQTVDQVRMGNHTARARRSPFADPHIDTLTETLNEMLDSLDHYRIQMQALSSEVLLAQEDERKRVARELHDSTGQLLTGLLLRLKSLENVSDPAVRSTARDLIDIAAQIMEDVRRTAVELRPPALDDLGLVAALRGYIAGYATTTGIEARFSADGIDARMPSNVELVLYRVVQEALTNTARHSSAARVTVSLIGHHDRIEAIIADDGRGFPVQSVLKSREGGLGIFGMRERVGLIDGRFSITSDHGTRIRIEVPTSLLTSEVTA